MKQIVTSILDNDLYSFTVMYYVIMNYPKAEVRYSFFDRGNEVYPPGFGDVLQEQVEYFKDVTVSDEELALFKKKAYYFPEWYFALLKGFRLNPDHVHIFQDQSGYLSIMIEGPWWQIILWEMILLATISEMSHIYRKESLDESIEFSRAYEKAKMLIEGGCAFADMGTRRRFSLSHQENVIKAFKAASEEIKGKGKFLGTSNVLLALKYDLTMIGTMSHQIISAEEVVSGVHEANWAVMNKWQNTFKGSLGLYLYDCFGDKAYFDNVDRTSLMMFDGVRVDSGDEKDQLQKICANYTKFGINHQEKSVCFSNALDGKKAVELHSYINGAVKDTYGIGTWFTCNFDAIGDIPGLPIKNKNIVIKLTGFRFNPERKWQTCVKLSSDPGKTTGDKAKCEQLLRELA